ncbi:MAG: hypothetical protein KIT84_32150 [Labilithrix sp.]|nr:hypothetical protein [Labilithrix sp.]MCW5815725.1 hypothetical protein [Labilithrix sp.]
MEGDREEPPNEKRLSLCEKHGLHFDPSVHAGCTLCRRDVAPAPAVHDGAARRVVVAGAVLVVVTFGGLLGYRQWTRSKATPVGSACTIDEVCEDGAECVQLIGRSPTCMRSCRIAASGEDDCASGSICTLVSNSANPDLAGNYCIIVQ